MDTFEQIIEYAIRHEEAEAAFYNSLAERAESKDLKKALLVHAQEEEEHKRHLQKILANHRIPGGGRRYPNPDLKLSDYLVEVPMQDTGKISYQDALIMAAKREATAQRLYLALSRNAKDPELAEIFTFLAEQEGKHKYKLEREYEDEILEEG